MDNFNDDTIADTDNNSSAENDVVRDLDAKIKSSGSDILGFELGESTKHGDLFSYGNKTFGGFTEKGVKLGESVNVKVGGDYFSLSGESKNEVSIDDLHDDNKRNIGFKNTNSVTKKIGLKEKTFKNTNTAGYDGKRFTVGFGTDRNKKYGTKDYNIDFNGGKSVKFGNNYSKAECHGGANVKAGSVEGGLKHTSSETNETQKNDKGKEVKTQTHSEKTEISGGVEIGSGVTIKNTTAVESKESISKSENGSVKTNSTSITNKTRMEVDSEKAGPGMVFIAGVINTEQYIEEQAMKDAFTVETVESEDYYNGYGY